MIKQVKKKEIKPKNFVSNVSSIEEKERVSNITIKNYVTLVVSVSLLFTIITTMLIFFLQGFNLFGFHLTESAITIMAGSLLVEVISLSAIVYRKVL